MLKKCAYLFGYALFFSYIYAYMIIKTNKDICGKIWLPQIGFVYLQGKTGESPNIN